jgi:plastocyanin
MTTIDKRTTTTQTRPDSASGRSWIVVLAWLSIVAAVVDVGLPALSGVVIPPLAIGAVLTVIGLALLRRSWKVGVGVLGVVNLLLLLSSAPFAAPGLAHPESPLTFVHAVVGLGGRLLAVVAAVGAWRHASPAAARRLGMTAVGLLGLTVVTAGVATLVTTGATEQPGDVVVTVRDIAFPEEVRVASGGTVLVDNTDLLRHTFTVEGTAVSEELPERARVRVRIDLAEGTYRLLCAVPGHEDMTATMVVE